MPELQTYLEYNDPLSIIYRTGAPNDAYKQRSDALPIINNIITLLEIPSETHKVQIAGFTEISLELYKKKSQLAENEFIVNYSNGIIQFNPLNDGKSLICNYFGRGLILYPASRVYAMVSRNPDVVVTLQDYIDEISDQLAAYNQKLVEINNTISLAKEAIINTNQATDNANRATENAIIATEAAIDAHDSTIMVYLPPVPTYEEIETTYPNPVNGSRVMVTSTGDIYRFDGIEDMKWEWIDNYVGGSIPTANETTDGFLKKEDYSNLHTKLNTKQMIFIIPKPMGGDQKPIIQFPLDGTITKINSFCLTSGEEDESKVTIRKITETDFEITDEWSDVATIDFIPGTKLGRNITLLESAISQGDYFKIYCEQVDEKMLGLTVQADVQIFDDN